MNADAPPAAADILIRGCDVVCLDEAGTVLRNAAIAVAGGRIVWMGHDAEAAARFTATETIFARGRVAMPGLVDAHTHLAQTLLKGRLAGLARRGLLRIPVWRNYLIPFEGLLEPEDVYLGALVGGLAMLSNGTTCFADSGGPHPEEMARAAEEIGLRGFVAWSTMDQGAGIPPSMLATTELAIRRNHDLVASLGSGGRIRGTYALRQILVCSSDLIREITRLAAAAGILVHTHLAEGTYEVDFTLERSGLRPAFHLDELGAFAAKLHCAHAVMLAPDEVGLLRDRDASVIQCPFVNYMQGSPRMAEMMQRGVTVAMGTDGAAHRGTLDLFQVMHLAEIGQQALFGMTWHIRNAVEPAALLRAATVGGAAALGLGEEIGSLQLGRCADIVLVRTSGLDQLLSSDPIFVLTHNAVGRDVDTVLIDGRVVLRDGRPVGVDLERVEALWARRGPRLLERLSALTD